MVAHLTPPEAELHRAVLQVDRRRGAAGCLLIQDGLHARRAQPLQHEVVVPGDEHLVRAALRAEPAGEVAEELGAFVGNLRDGPGRRARDVSKPRLGEAVA